jgi:hypothetical protein
LLPELDLIDFANVVGWSAWDFHQIHPSNFLVWWMVIMDQPRLISLNLIEFAPSCGRPILGGSLPVVSFVFACSSSSYGSIRGPFWSCGKV